MSFNYVKVYHGPCNSFHSLKHKPQRLRGLQDHLQKLGYRVDLVEVPHVNYLLFEMCDQEVFRCNMLNLKFNTHYARDPIAKRAVEAVLQATDKLKIARTHLWIRNLLYEELFTRGPHAPMDYWSDDRPIRAYTTCNECVTCCDILVERRQEKKMSISRCFEFNVCPSEDSLHVD